MGISMDRRQRKTRKAIFEAFITLLSTKHYNNITVGEIIELADVGRATFYAHFETKDFLLKDLCTELFDHLFQAETDIDGNPTSLFHCNTKASPFLHLFQHIQENDNNLAKLLSSKNNELFFDYFKNGVRRMVTEHLHDFEAKRPPTLPDDFWTNHITSTFIETLKWWLEHRMDLPPARINEYFLLSV